MTDAEWIDRCAGQVGRRWQTIDPAHAVALATTWSTEPLHRQREPELVADSEVWEAEIGGPVTPSALRLVFVAEGATPAQCDLAVAAAAAAIAEAGITPAAASWGRWAREVHDDMGFPEDEAPPASDMEAAFTWDRACAAAYAAAALGDEYAGRWYLDLQWQTDANQSTSAATL